MRIALDTNAYTNLLRGEPAVVAVVAAATHVYLPVIVLGELLAGFACGHRPAENQTTLNRFLESPKVSLLTVDGTTAEVYARFFRQLRQQGTPIPTNDLWIAALTAQHQLQLCSRDQHFDTLPEISRC